MAGGASDPPVTGGVEVSPEQMRSARAGRRSISRTALQRLSYIRGVGGRGIAGQQLGPDLTHIGSRLFSVPACCKTIATLATGSQSAQDVKPGARMPSFGDIDDEDLFALSSYLEHLK
jgi:cytochrome c oxidase subunit 2